jgi:Domain of unknown function (DUF4263)
MWLTAHSATWFPTLIEIEAPHKPLFTKSGIPSQQFTQARNQLAQWRVWFREPANVQKFVSEYGIPEDYTKFRTMQPHFVLVYGRRREFAGNSEMSKHRSALISSSDEELMSFDRLRPDRGLRDAITVRATGFGRFHVVNVMPTLSMGPMVAERLPVLDGLEQAIGVDERIPSERRLFLQRRSPYWRQWALQRGSGIVRGSDSE